MTGGAWWTIGFSRQEDEVKPSGKLLPSWERVDIPGTQMTSMREGQPLKTRPRRVIYLHLPQKSTIHVAKCTSLMDPMAIIFYIYSSLKSNIDTQNDAMSFFSCFDTFSKPSFLGIHYTYRLELTPCPVTVTFWDDYIPNLKLHLRTCELGRVCHVCIYSYLPTFTFRVCIDVSKNRGFSPQIIHWQIGVSMIFTIHFGGCSPYFWKHPNMQTCIFNTNRSACELIIFSRKTHGCWGNPPF